MLHCIMQEKKIIPLTHKHWLCICFATPRELDRNHMKGIHNLGVVAKLEDAWSG